MVRFFNPVDPKSKQQNYANAEGEHGGMMENADQLMNTMVGAVGNAFGAKEPKNLQSKGSGEGQIYSQSQAGNNHGQGQMSSQGQNAGQNQGNNSNQGQHQGAMSNQGQNESKSQGEMSTDEINKLGY